MMIMILLFFPPQFGCHHSEEKEYEVMTAVVVVAMVMVECGQDHAEPRMCTGCATLC